jgi:hypothetical protein
LSFLASWLLGNWCVVKYEDVRRTTGLVERHDDDLTMSRQKCLC